MRELLDKETSKYSVEEMGISLSEFIMASSTALSKLKEEKITLSNSLAIEIDAMQYGMDAISEFVLDNFSDTLDEIYRLDDLHEEEDYKGMSCN